jgi:salicylate hydroxylase
VTIHRADYQRILYEAALQAGAEVKFDKKVVSINTNTPSLTLEYGSIVRSDVIIRADGFLPINFSFETLILT